MFTKTLKPLTGHTSPETAFICESYPYGFKLRCKIRYWLEYKAKQGFRLVSQTTNPKRSTEFWNKPKASTYSNLGVMGLDDQNHVAWTGLHYDFEDLDAFFEAYGASFNENQTKVFKAMKAAYDRYQAKKAEQAMIVREDAIIDARGCSRENARSYIRAEDREKQEAPVQA